MITRKAIIIILTLVLVVGVHAKPKEEIGDEPMAKEEPMDDSEVPSTKDNTENGEDSEVSDDLVDPKEDLEENTEEDPKVDPEEDPEDGPKEVSLDVEDDSKKSVKNFTCKITEAVLSMAQSIMELTKDIKAIKNQMFEKCPGFNASEGDSLDLLDNLSGSIYGLNTTNDKTNLEDEGDDVPEGEEEEEELPPIPTECDEPFQPVANSCYYFLYYPPDWKTWGDANAYCQTFGGTLAAPARYEDLRNYLQENFSNVFWVGAKKPPKKDTYEWLTGKELSKEDWKEGQPSKSAAKFCVYLESFSGYKAINHYCGEKFSFVCEKRAESD